jgi:hypothetical protein
VIRGRVVCVGAALAVHAPPAPSLPSAGAERASDIQLTSLIDAVIFIEGLSFSLYTVLQGMACGQTKMKDARAASNRRSAAHRSLSE